MKYIYTKEQIMQIVSLLDFSADHTGVDRVVALANAREILNQYERPEEPQKEEGAE